MRGRLTVLIGGLLALGLSFLSCQPVVSTNPVASDGSPVDAAPFVGEWTLATIEGSAGPPVNLTVLASGGDISLTYSDASDSETWTVQLIDIGGTTVGLRDCGDGLWQFARISVENGSNDLVVDLVDRTVVSGDIENGLIDGVLEPTEGAEVVVRLTATPEELREYVRTKADLFLTHSFVFQRTE